MKHLKWFISICSVLFLDKILKTINISRLQFIEHSEAKIIILVTMLTLTKLDTKDLKPGQQTQAKNESPSSMELLIYKPLEGIVFKYTHVVSNLYD